MDRVLVAAVLLLASATALAPRGRLPRRPAVQSFAPRVPFAATRRFLLDDKYQSVASAASEFEPVGLPQEVGPETPLRPEGRVQTRRLNVLRDAQWLKGISADLTSAEFVVSMGMMGGAAAPVAPADPEVDPVAARTKLMKLEALDLDRLRRRLERNMRRIGDRRGKEDDIFRLDAEAAELLEDRMQQAIAALQPRAPARKAAKKAVEKAEQQAETADTDGEEETTATADGSAELFEREKGFQVPSDAEKQALVELKSIALDFFRKPRNETLLRLFMREDGTVDWDSARGEVVNFGGDLFDRLNGKADAEDNHGGGLMQSGRSAVIKLAKADERVAAKVAAKTERTKQYEAAVSRREGVAERLRLLRWEAAGEEPDERFLEEARVLREDLRAREREVRLANKLLGLATMDEQMEMACLSLVNEVDTGFMQPTELRLLVAEFGFLDAQLCAMLDVAVAADLSDVPDIPVEDAEVSVMTVEVRELLVRLGLADTDLGVKLQFGPFGSFFADLYQKAREGLRFYWVGTKIIFNDVQYALGLVARAATTKYTLKPREVRTLRRTFKDVLTFIPFVIILIIPLTPVGHVLVFSFIQRFFPDFFPSCYTDRRQNLLKIYDSIDKVDSLESELDTSAGLRMLNVVVARWPKAGKALRSDYLNGGLFNSVPRNGFAAPNRRDGL